MCQIVIGSMQKHAFIGNGDYCPSLTEAMGKGGGQIPMIADIKVIGRMDHTIDNTLESANRVYDTEGLSPTLNTCGGGGLEPKIIDVEEVPKIKIRQATEQGFVECEVGGVVDLNYPKSQTRRGRAEKNGQICPTLTTENIPSVVEFGSKEKFNFIYNIDGVYYRIRIRKLTPRECWRLMGFTDEDFDKAQAVNSNTQLYKQAGNSIVVNVLEEIFKQMIDTNSEM